MKTFMNHKKTLFKKKIKNSSTNLDYTLEKQSRYLYILTCTISKANEEQ